MRVKRRYCTLFLTLTQSPLGKTADLFSDVLQKGDVPSSFAPNTVGASLFYLKYKKYIKSQGSKKSGKRPFGCSGVAFDDADDLPEVFPTGRRSPFSFSFRSGYCYDSF